MQFKLNVNNKKYTVDVAEDTPLLWVLRDSLQLLGTKFSCGIGQCGACTVLINNQPIRSCSYPINIVKDQSVMTIEGIFSEDKLHPIQQAWKAVDVPQCGYCQSGQILTAYTLLKRYRNPTKAQINNAMDNICRCGSYPEIIAAIQLAAKHKKVFS